MISVVSVRPCERVYFCKPHIARRDWTVLARACRTGLKAHRVEAPSSWHGGNDESQGVREVLGKIPAAAFSDHGDLVVT
jgi:hypothetical protein